MLSYLTLKNFKCFEEQSFALGNLTIVAGANGAGKSTLIQALMLLRQSDACVRRNRTVSEKMRIEDLVDRGDGTGRMCALTSDGHVWLELHRIAIFAVPFLDETIQLFTEGRSGQISDVWLDMAGACFGLLAAALVKRLWNMSRRRGRRRRGWR